MQERRDKIIITILDGGMGHELKMRGVSDGTFLAGILANESSSSNHDVVEQIHTDYLEAGCHVITTNSFVAVSVCHTGRNARSLASHFLKIS